ncbi:TetR/AcrR family transcriptional regulator [Paenibacillus sp. sgz302251]|uniref:TetR/AcrR family transcriptional regulator n=1 Tax=Paenibacillus sp. sgz302251 TaxID=3414493 RepID=UPI003C7BB0D6
MMTTGEADVKMRILQAAKKLFSEYGFEKTTVRQICEEAGANLALVSYHFGGKENMFAALFESYFPNDQLAEVDPSIDPIEGVRLVIREVTSFRYRDPELISIIQQEIIMNTERIQKIRMHVMPMWRLLRHWLEQGREQGIFHFQSLDSTLMSVIGTLLFHRNTSYWEVLLEEAPPSAEEMIEDLTTFVMNALQRKSK